MIEFLRHTPAEQRQAFLLTAQKKHLPEPSIEKDWWVTQILNLVFSLPIADQFADCRPTGFQGLYVVE